MFVNYIFKSGLYYCQWDKIDHDIDLHENVFLSNTVGSQNKMTFLFEKSRLGAQKIVASIWKFNIAP